MATPKRRGRPAKRIKTEEQLIKEVENKSTGIGDTVAKITKAIGIEPCVDCKKRQRFLNYIFPYIRELSQEEIDLVKKIHNTSIWERTDIDKVIDIYNSLINPSVKLNYCLSCTGLINAVVEKLINLIHEQEQINQDNIEKGGDING